MLPMEPFRLQNDPPPLPRPTITEPEPTVQRRLLSGMDCLPGQLDLFDIDRRPTRSRSAAPRSSEATSMGPYWP